MDEIVKRISEIKQRDENIIQQLIKKQESEIDCRILFSEQGNKLREQLYLSLNATKSSPLYNGWKEFGVRLEINPEIIRSIENNVNDCNPTNHVLLEYIKKDNATVEEILNALYLIKRKDILLRLADLIKELRNSLRNLQENLIEPATNNENGKVVIKQSHIYNNIRIQNNQLQRSIPTPNVQKRQRNYDKIILLTYSSDADDIVKNLTTTFRNPICGYKLGVMILNEHPARVSQNPTKFIFDSLHQVDYIFPILTHEYIKSITKKVDNDNLQNLDHKYANYIYNLLNSSYLHAGCRNLKVRCLIPDSIVHDILNYRIMIHPLFQSWKRISQSEELIKLIIQQKI